MTDDNSKQKSIQDQVGELKKAAEERAEQDLNAKMDSNEMQKVIYPSDKIAFYSQGMIENKTIFLPNSSRQTSFIISKDNELQITIGKAGGHKDYGVLKTKHRDVMYAVLAIWASQNWPVWKNQDGVRLGVIKTSRYKILNLILQKNPGSDNYKSLMDTLYDLKVIPIEVEDINSEETKEVFSMFFGFDFESEKGNDVITIYLNPYITRKYYEQKDLKLLFYNTYRNLSSDIAKTLYPIIDRALGINNEYSKKVIDLCNENGMTTYRYNADYRTKWKKALIELNKIELTNGKKIVAEFYENSLKELIFIVKSAK
ncbi:MAG TPA: hypothetical protein PLZ43_11205 [bacterium]|nr:hypothetical protein [bacterium]